MTAEAPDMPPRPKSDLFGGIVLCALPATILLAMHLGGSAPLPMPWPILFATFFVYGLRSIATSLLRLDLESPASWLADAAGAAGLAAFAFCFAWTDTLGDFDAIPFIPAAWTARLGQILFSLGGLIAALVALRCVLKAFNQLRNKPDDGITHV